MTEPITFYFDYISPFSYFAWLRLKELKTRYRLELIRMPVLFAGLLNHWENLGPAEIPPKRRYMFEYCVRYARLNRIPFQGPAKHPFNSLTALRISLPEISGEDQEKVIDRLFRAAWVEGEDLGEDATIARLLSEKWLEKSRDPSVKDRLRKNTEEAIANGVFGVPSFRIAGQLFWGNDSMEHLELRIQGKDPLDQKFVEEVLARPRGADRPRVSGTPRRA